MGGLVYKRQMAYVMDSNGCMVQRSAFVLEEQPIRKVLKHPQLEETEKADIFDTVSPPKSMHVASRTDTQGFKIPEARRFVKGSDMVGGPEMPKSAQSTNRISKSHSLPPAINEVKVIKPLVRRLPSIPDIPV